MGVSVALLAAARNFHTLLMHQADLWPSFSMPHCCGFPAPASKSGSGDLGWSPGVRTAQSPPHPTWVVCQIQEAGTTSAGGGCALKLQNRAGFVETQRLASREQAVGTDSGGGVGGTCTHSRFCANPGVISLKTLNLADVKGCT